MNSKRRRYNLLLTSMVVLVFLASGTLRTAKAYDYIQGDWESYESASDNYYDSSSSYVVNEYADSSADEETRVCTCEVYAAAKALLDQADAFAYANGEVQTSWTWSGPPEYAPGGWLTWSHDAYGDYTGAWGHASWPASSESNSGGQSETDWWGGGAYAGATPYGYVRGTYSYGDSIQTGNPYEDFTPGYELEYDYPPDYSYLADGWSFTSSDEHSIPAGTTNFTFEGEIHCWAYSETDNRGSTYWSEAHGDAAVEFECDADFVSN